MSRRRLGAVTLTLDRIVGGGQAIGTLENGQKCLVWGGLPNEEVRVQLTKKKTKWCEGRVEEILNSSPDRIEPREDTSYLSTSPWQIMDFKVEQHYKAALIEEAFELHDIVLPEPIDVYTDQQQYQYRNKLEFSWYSEADATSGTDTLDLAFFKRGSKGKITVNGSELAYPQINQLAREIRDILRTKKISARQLKTLLIRSTRNGDCVWQLYIKDKLAGIITEDEFAELSYAKGGEIIYSDPRSPASVITKRLTSFGDLTLKDKILDTTFHYAAEGFFQINLPVYEQALNDMKSWINEDKVLDMYAGVGSIGLTIGGEKTTLIELNEHAVREMKRNIAQQNSQAKAVLAASENALMHIKSDTLVIVDPPRAGLHMDVINRLLEVKPPRIIYLSCNPVTQARDVALLAKEYGIKAHQGYNFFARTPHIEHLIILDRLAFSDKI